MKKILKTTTIVVFAILLAANAVGLFYNGTATNRDADADVRVLFALQDVNQTIKTEGVEYRKSLNAAIDSSKNESNEWQLIARSSTMEFKKFIGKVESLEKEVKESRKSSDRNAALLASYLDTVNGTTRIGFKNLTQTTGDVGKTIKEANRVLEGTRGGFLNLFD